MITSVRRYLLFLFVSMLVVQCTGTSEKPDVSSEAYRKAVGDFYISLAAIQSNQALLAVEKMDSLAQTYPQEPAFWANLAVFSMRQGNLDKAATQMEKALDESPDNARMRFLAGLLERRRGNVDAAIRYLRQAAEADPSDLQMAYALAGELQRQDDVGNAEEVVAILERILETQPDNLAVLLEITRAAVKWEDRPLLEETMQTLTELSQAWPQDVQRQFREIKEAILTDSDTNVTFQLAFLRNNLNQLAQFQHDVSVIEMAATEVGFLITELGWLPQPTVAVAPADTALRFNATPNAQAAGLLRTVALSEGASPDIVRVQGDALLVNGERQATFPGRPLSRNAIETIDYNYDFMNDMILAGSGGIKLLRQNEDATFTDVTSAMQLPAGIAGNAYHGVWAQDIDLDGDLDLLLSPERGPLLVLRNNGDGRFEEQALFPSIQHPTHFGWADFDADGDSDAAFIDPSGTLRLFLNERSSQFEEVETVPPLDGLKALDVADINNDGRFDLLMWNPAGILRVYRDDNTGSWQKEVLADPPASFGDARASEASLFAIDIDNNGANDVLITTPERSGYWLNGADLKIKPPFYPLPGGIDDIEDLNGDTRLDVMVRSADGTVTPHLNEGAKAYRARIIRPTASGTVGDRRINSFGIGGAIEIRSGLLYQKQLIKQPRVHLGLGTYDEAKMLRIIWPNGSSQAEFAELGYGSKIFNEQVLKGSCPWVFTYNGEEMAFVTDFIWRTGLGIRINAQGDANVIHSIDWVKVDGDQLVPREGLYDVRITADLWETHFFDHVGLRVIDHPEDTEVIVDERFTFPPKEPGLHVVGTLNPIHIALDNNGRDVTADVAAIDDAYVDSFGLTDYQGVAEEHYLEVALGDDVPVDGPLKLIASGWIYPTDTSVNIAVSQGSAAPPQPLKLQIPDGAGGWETVRENIGFPAGKSKTMVIDLEGLFPEGVEPNVRLVTSMEIYWNRMMWSIAQPERQIDSRDMALASADLRYRGFSEVERPGRFKPEKPNYQSIAGTTPIWNDLEGFYTRFGRIDTLLHQRDDRYVIMNAGDELVLTFSAADEPVQGMKRDFVLIGDGWVKDGDFNTGFSQTVRPLPYHGMEDYGTPPGRLQDDPVYQQHTADWVNYHTRYITPRAFIDALQFGGGQEQVHRSNEQ